MIQVPPAAPRAHLLHSLSAALHKTPVMARMHDPNHTLSYETARQLVASLDRLGITVTVTGDAPNAVAVAMNVPSAQPSDAEREIARLHQEQDAYLDEALKETFPASDSIAPGRPHAHPPS